MNKLLLSFVFLLSLFSVCQEQEKEKPVTFGPSMSLFISGCPAVTIRPIKPDPDEVGDWAAHQLAGLILEWKQTHEEEARELMEKWGVEVQNCPGGK